MDRVSLKLSTMRDIDLRIQDNISSWMKLIEGDDHRLTKAVSHLFDQRRDRHLILPWTYIRHLLDAFRSSMAELIQATKVYYSTVEEFVTSDPLLLNLRRVAGHITRESDMYVFRGWRRPSREEWGDMCKDSDEWALGGVVWESGGAPSCH